ncbi:MAG: PulJ/GspJ family protein [Motilibacteraceae bacterium]
MTTFTRLVRRRGREDGGYTLIEMMVAMVVLSLALAMITTALIRSQTLTRDLEATADSASEVRIALAQIDRQVRSGNVLYSPANEPAQLASCTASGSNAGSCMRVYTQANGEERCVQWQVLTDPDHAGTNLLRSRAWSPDWQTDGKVTDWGIVARGLNPSAGAPFTLQGATTAYSRRLLDVKFEALDTRRGKSTVIESSLSGRNTNYGYDPGQCSPEPAG